MLQTSYFTNLTFPEKMLWFIGLFVAGWLLTKLLIFLWEKLILPMASKTESSLDDHLAKNVHKPVTRLMILGSLYLAALLTIGTAKEIEYFVNPLGGIL